MTTPLANRRWFNTFLAWYFVTAWGSGFVASKIGIQYAAPFTFLALRFMVAIACMIPIVLIMRPRWPVSRVELGHVIAAGLIMHAVHLGASHYAQFLGVSAGITAVVLTVQTLLTALVASRWLGEQLNRRQWLGIGIGLAGVMLVVWHKIDIREMTLVSLGAVIVALLAVTAGTLYQRVFCPQVDLRASALVQFVATGAVLTPLAWIVEDFSVAWTGQRAGSIVFLVIGSSVLAVGALPTLMRRGEATRVTSMFYLPPVVAVALEYALFGVVPTMVSVLGIAITCAGVALVAWKRDPPAPE